MVETLDGALTMYRESSLWRYIAIRSNRGALAYASLMMLLAIVGHMLYTVVFTGSQLPVEQFAFVLFFFVVVLFIGYDYISISQPLVSKQIVIEVDKNRAQLIDLLSDVAERAGKLNCSSNALNQSVDGLRNVTRSLFLSSDIKDKDVSEIVAMCKQLDQHLADIAAIESSELKGV